MTQAVQSVVMPLLALALQIWQDAMAGVQAAWAAYGQPVLAGAAAAVQNLCAILLAFWSGTLQPLLQNLIARLGALWQSTLQPLFNDLALAVGSVVNLLLTLWNTALAPLLNFLVSSFGPLAAQVFTALAGGVALAVQTAGGALDSLLILLRGLADFLTQGLLGRWTEAWAAMGEAVRGAWQRITSTVQGAVSGLLALVSDFAAGVVRAVNNALSALASLRGRAAAGAVPRRPPAARGLRFTPRRRWPARRVFRRWRRGRSSRPTGNSWRFWATSGRASTSKPRSTPSARHLPRRWPPGMAGRASPSTSTWGTNCWTPSSPAARAAGRCAAGGEGENLEFRVKS